jgi:hypothetical protein
MRGRRARRAAPFSVPRTLLRGDWRENMAKSSSYLEVTHPINLHTVFHRYHITIVCEKRWFFLPTLSQFPGLLSALAASIESEQ